MGTIRTEQSNQAKWIFGLAAAIVISVSTSCGGGGAAVIPPPGGGGPAAGTANISGQLQEGAGGKVISAVGDSLAGVLVQLINTATGKLAGTDVTDLTGKYEFKGVPSGQQYLLKVEFTSSRDLNGDGVNDQVELTLPLNPSDQATVNLLQQLGVEDTNGDGQLDAIRFENEINDDKGGITSRDSEHRFDDGQTVVDDNGNGDFGDDTPFDDSDCDGIADDSGTGGGTGGGDDSGVLENAARGAIEAITPDSLTVGGLTFALTNATKFLGLNNETLTAASFTTGALVEVEGFGAAATGWTAYKVKLEDGVAGGGDDNAGIGDELEKFGTIEAITAQALTVGGVSFAITADTLWRSGDNLAADPAEFTVGMTVEVTGDGNGHGGWIARKVHTEDNLGGGTGGGGTGDELEKFGAIQALTGDAITVDGVSFAITPNTIWRVGNDETATQADFTAGMTVEVTGDADGHGGWTARRVKTED
jgi:hypothetical protein